MSDFIHKFVPGRDGTEWMLLLLHGTGGDEEDLISLGEQMGGGAALLSPRGKVLENGMPRFFRRLAPGILDEKDLRERSQELSQFVQKKRDGWVRSAKILAFGYSNGANIAASLLMLEPELLAGAVLLRPMLPYTNSTIPDLKGKPVWIGGGRRDTIIDPAQTAELGKRLSSAGAAVEMHWSPGGHQLDRDELASAKEWMAKILI